MTNEQKTKIMALVERLCLDIDPELSDPVSYYEAERLEAAECIESLVDEIERIPRWLQWILRL